MERFNKVASITNAVLNFVLTLLSVIAAGVAVYNNELITGLLWLVIFSQSVNSNTLRELSDKINKISVTEKKPAEK